MVEGGEFGGDLGGGEEELEGFSGEGYALGEGVVGELLEWRQGGAGKAVVEDDAATLGAGFDEAYGCTEGFEGEVRDDTQPGEEGGGVGVEVGGEELIRDGVLLKVDGDVGKVRGDGDVVLLEQGAFGVLGSREVEFEDVKLGVGVAVSEGVESGAEQDVLGDAALDGVGESVFGVAAAGDEEGAQGDGVGLVEAGGGLAEFFGVVGAEDGDCDGVVEDEGASVVDLVSGATKGDTQSSAGWAGRSHARMILAG